ncbi:MAG TPA: hypothetical protein VFU02_22970 [Polyangiaceae bacterium]|nr:hypothetical protein [Polyangiaceae bacterium]
MDQISEETEPEVALPEAPLLMRIGVGLGGGALMGVALLLLGLARAVVALALGAHLATPTSRDLHSALTYVAAFAVAGAVTAALWPLRKTLIGAYALGYIGAGIVVTAIALTFSPTDSTDSVTSTALLIGIITLAFGTALGSGLRSSEEDMAVQRRVLIRRLRAKARARGREQR